uniref:Uncharacterized protein n=1 Tax=Gallus gallus TaxID=9031 RepID=A0A8V0Y3M0_CHICK
MGALSFISRTTMRISVEPVRGGEPPSVATRVKSISGCSSLSRGFSKTSSINFSFSLSREKCEFGERL